MLYNSEKLLFLSEFALFRSHIICDCLFDVKIYGGDKIKLTGKVEKEHENYGAWPLGGTLYQAGSVFDHLVRIYLFRRADNGFGRNQTNEANQRNYQITNRKEERRSFWILKPRRKL